MTQKIYKARATLRRSRQRRIRDGWRYTCAGAYDRLGVSALLAVAGTMNALHLSLTEEAFRLKEAGKVKEAAWILKYIHFERHKPKGTRKERVQIQGTDDRGVFWIDPEKIPPEKG